jgi:hypothetical protein
MFIDRKEIGGAGAFDHLDDDELNKTIEALAEEVHEIEKALLPPPSSDTIRQRGSSLGDLLRCGSRAPAGSPASCKITRGFVQIWIRGSR